MNPRSFLFAFVLFFLLVQANYALRPFIIDTDVGTDDEIAMLYMLSQKDIDVKAITIAASGETHCQPGLRNVTGILQATHKATIPLACGRDEPLAGHHVFPDWLRKQADTSAGPALAVKDKITPSLSAIALLAKTLQQTKQPIDILAIGPLTNIAEFMMVYPGLKNKIRMIYVMGGAVDVPGNIIAVDRSSKNKWAEWNIYIDPTAADVVFRSGVPVTLISLDVTNQAPVTPTFYERIKKNKSSVLYPLFSRNEAEIYKKEWYFWDVMAAAVAADESLVTIEDRQLRVVLTPSIKSGATVVDKKRGSHIRVCTAVNKLERFENMLTMLSV